MSRVRLGAASSLASDFSTRLPRSASRRRRRRPITFAEVSMKWLLERVLDHPSHTSDIFGVFEDTLEVRDETLGYTLIVDLE